jgi:hypothetical protein
MKRVLVTFAIVFTVFIAVSFACPDASAGCTDDLRSLSVGGVQAPQGSGDQSGLCGGDSSEGDPDDLGGGFRSTNGRTKQGVGENKQPVTPLIDLMLTVQRIWAMILR